ncbi:MAG: Uma2 family endonuclease [Acidobacteriota bacterium]
MSKPAHQVCYTFTEYLAIEEFSNVKHEFLAGQMYAMPGATPEHAMLAASASGALYGQLRGGLCRVADSDLRIRTGTGLATYPDVTVVCGPSERDVEDRLAATNPALIIEVLSDSTEEYDRGDKFAHYKSLPSLRQYLLVSHREHSVEVWTRDGDSWQRQVVREGEVAQLVIGANLDVRELYAAAAEPSE